uniref:Uncharacterized protein n=1 Tax=Ascaris lumbricoides TaxID=6252 RepID=A0A0M3I8B7_ASCLU
MSVGARLGRVRAAIAKQSTPRAYRKKYRSYCPRGQLAGPRFRWSDSPLLLCLIVVFHRQDYETTVGLL